MSVREHNRPDPASVNQPLRVALEREFGKSFERLMRPVSMSRPR